MAALPLFLSFLIVGMLAVGAIPLSASAVSTAPSAPSFSDQAADIEQGNVYTWISTLFTTGYTATASIPSGTGTVYYTPDLLASASSVAEIQILSMSGQVLSASKGTGYSVSDTFDFSFSGNSEYEMLLYFNNATSGGSTIATTTNGVLGVSRDGYVYDYSTNTQSTGTVFTVTSNITSSDLQATVYIKELGATPPPSDATIHFNEAGLASGTSWAVTYHSVLNGYTGANITSTSTNSFVNVTMAIGNTIYYWISDSAGLTPSPSEGVISLTGNMTVSVTFPTPAPASFSITFIPSGIPSGVTWGVTLQGETLYATNLNGQNPDIIFNEPDGSYSYSIYVPSPYIASPGSGTVQVSGSSISVTIGISQPQVNYYILSFTETGLPSGTDFTVSTGVGSASGNPTASFTVPDGTYSYTIADVGNYVPSPAYGSVTVSGASVTVSVTFAIPTYPVTFMEAGLPSGTSWSVTLSGSTLSSTGTSITFHEVSGSYAYSIGSISGYSVSPSSGTATVSGSGVSISVTYSQIAAEKYQVTFHETGLSSGNWFVNISGQSSSGPISYTQGSYSISLVNGSYSYAVSTGNKNYKPAYTGSFAISGAPIAEYITFSPVTYTVTFTESGLSSGVRWGVTFNGTSLTSSSSSVEFTLIPAGTYSYTAVASGYNTISGTLTVTSSMTEQLTFTSSITITPPPSVTISSSQDYYVNGTLTAPPGYSLQQFDLVTVDMSWNSSIEESLTFLPTANFSIQVPALNTTYHLSFVLTGTDLRSGRFNTTAAEKSAQSVTGSYLPSSYSFYPASGSVVYSSETVGIFLKGNVTYSGILILSSAYGISKNITLQSKSLGNGTQSLYYALNINNFSIGQYNFKYLIIYNGKVQTSLTAQYFIEAQNAITLKYTDNYSETPSGAYNVSFNISVVDNSSVRYSPVNLLNVSLGHDFWFLTGRTEVTNGTARDYFLLTIYNLSKGEYKLNLTAYNRTGNVPYMIFSTSYNFTVPSLPPSITGGFSWEYARNWLQQGYNEYYVAGIAAVIVIGTIYAYSTGSFTGSRITSSQGSSQNQEKPQGINIRIVNSRQRTAKSERRKK